MRKEHKLNGVPVYYREFEGEVAFDFQEKVFACQRLATIQDMQRHSWLLSHISIGSKLVLSEGVYRVTNNGLERLKLERNVL